MIHIFKKIFGRKEAVDVEVNMEGGRRGRFTVAVTTMLDDVADDIIGRQVRCLLSLNIPILVSCESRYLKIGEDMVLLLSTVVVLPIVQANVFFSVNQGPTSSDALIPPTYHDVLICLVLIAGLLEMVSTILTYVALLKVGIHLDHR